MASPQALIRELHSRTAGNPLFITEVVRLLHQQGLLSRAGMTVHLHRYWESRPACGKPYRAGWTELSQDCHHILTVAAIIGRQFGLAELERLMETLSSGQVVDAVEEALAAGIVEEVPGMLSAYQFAHVLIQESSPALCHPSDVPDCTGTSPRFSKRCGRTTSRHTPANW